MSQHSGGDFFAAYYQKLRNQEPMRWMVRMFRRLVSNEPPQLVDLPTGSGKTDLIVIWLLALAWYGRDRSRRAPVPRRMVWVVNRRVLVQQVFELAEVLKGALDHEDEELRVVREGLLELCRNPEGACFGVVQLRGQHLDDREWSLDPTVPRLIIGTIDQIGSRLLFQGYGCGKWSRPLQAGLFGVDAWVCIDEAHLVPAFALTLRQIREHVRRPLRGPAEEQLGPVFAKLPFWTTELSATPSLPKPSAREVFSIADEDQSDDRIADRLLAAKTRQVSFRWLADPKELADEMALEAEKAAVNGASVAVFCRTVKVAQKIAGTLRKKPAFRDRIRLLTGRLRGYEREQFLKDAVLTQFRPSSEKRGEPSEKPAFLIGTAAAEVGLDADADSVICDFAPLPTLLQRLGRLDRRGVLSRKAQVGHPPPRMLVVTCKPKASSEFSAFETLAERLKEYQYESDSGACLFTGNAWIGVTEGLGIEEAVELATWKTLEPIMESGTVKSPDSWLNQKFASVAAGPVVVSPLPSNLVDLWAASTNRASDYLPVHAWLYGLIPDSEGTPLVRIAFRLEMDLVQQRQSEDEVDGRDSFDDVLDIFKKFPPLRAEAHQIPLNVVRQWVGTHANKFRIAHDDGENWTELKATSVLRVGDVLVLPTSVQTEAVKALFEGSELVDERAATSDVFCAVSSDARYARKIQASGAAKGLQVVQVAEGVCRMEVPEGNRSNSQDLELGSAFCGEWESSKTCLSAQVGESIVRISYLRPARRAHEAQLLVDHHSLVVESAKRIAGAIAPGDEFVEKMLESAAENHDRGKEYKKWQQAMGNTDLANPIAKSGSEKTGTFGAYRHEWGSFLRVVNEIPPLPKNWSDEARDFWVDLWHHVILAHHGFFRPSMPEEGLVIPSQSAGQKKLRLGESENYDRLQRQLGPWRLAYLEGLLKAADVEASRETIE